MVECPLCANRVEELHPIPAEVITRDVSDLLDGTEAGFDVQICADCLHLLMEGESPSAVVLSAMDPPEIDPS